MILFGKGVFVGVMKVKNNNNNKLECFLAHTDKTLNQYQGPQFNINIKKMYQKAVGNGGREEKDTDRIQQTSEITSVWKNEGKEFS